jgi:hypothetical protein
MNVEEEIVCVRVWEYCAAFIEGRKSKNKIKGMLAMKVI